MRMLAASKRLLSYAIDTSETARPTVAATRLQAGESMLGIDFNLAADRLRVIAKGDRGSGPKNGPGQSSRYGNRSWNG